MKFSDIKTNRILLTTIVSIIFISVGWLIKENNYNQHVATIERTSKTGDTLQVKVDTLGAVVRATDNLAGVTNGISALPMSLMGDASSYTVAETTMWNKCYAGLEKFTKSLIKFRENAARLSGNDLSLYNGWIEKAEKFSEWSMCYKGSLYINTQKAISTDTDILNFKDRINGRISVLKTELDNAKHDLEQASSAKYFLWW